MRRRPSSRARWVVTSCKALNPDSERSKGIGKVFLVRGSRKHRPFSECANRCLYFTPCAFLTGQGPSGKFQLLTRLCASHAPHRPTLDKEPPAHDSDGAINDGPLYPGGRTSVMHAVGHARDHENGERKPKPFGQEYPGDSGIGHASLALVYE